MSSGKTQPGGAQKLTPHRKARRHCEVVERQTGGLWIYDMRVKTAATSRPVERRIYYFAGGGWQQPPSSQHWKFCAELCRALGPDTGVSIVSHPLAPLTPAKQAMPVLRAFYDEVMDQAASSGHRVVLAGDSSGGNLVLCLALCALTEAPHPVEDLAAAKAAASRTAPAALLLISPAVDLRPMRSEGIYATTGRNDPVLTIASHNAEAEQWAGGADPGEPWLSPINADAGVLAQSGVHVLAVT
ncbi:MAG: alpha/beta hydrolase, partial [Terriglobus roseus]|nr:alpha/beta hydrolase [Terriglobus roseus]